MDISDIVSTEFETTDGDARAAELDGILRERGVRAVVVTEDGEYRGVVTRRGLTTSHVDPDAKARGLLQHVARVGVDDGVRRVARAMVGSDAQLLPVFDGDDLVGVVTVDALLGKVSPFLGVLTVDDVATRELVSVAPDTTVGELLHVLREEGVAHLPVVDDGAAVGVVSVHDVLGFTTRAERREQGGSPDPSLAAGGRAHGGFGERTGDVARLLDLPAADVMVEPVRTTTPDAPLDDAVEAMLSAGVSSLVVTEDDAPVGIVTATDVLRALTWLDAGRPPVQITNVDLLDDITSEEVAELIDGVAAKYGALTVLEANVYLHEHEERLRGTPLVMARIRLFTDRGHFVGTGEGYGASHALRLVSNVVERQLLEGKEYARTKKHPDADERAKLYGWWLSAPRR